MSVRPQEDDFQCIDKHRQYLQASTKDLYTSIALVLLHDSADAISREQIAGEPAVTSDFSLKAMFIHIHV